MERGCLRYLPSAVTLRAVVRIHGTWIRHAQYGWQVCVNTFELTIISTVAASSLSWWPTPASRAGARRGKQSRASTGTSADEDQIHPPGRSGRHQVNPNRRPAPQPFRDGD
jgi:hypothetical protein